MNERILDHARYSRWTWIIALLLAIVLLLLWMTGRGPGAASACCGATGDATTPPPMATNDAGKPAPAPDPAAPEPVAAMQLAAFAAQQAGGKVTLTGVVADEAARAQVVQAAETAYGTGNVIDQLRIAGNFAPRGWDATLADIFAWQKTVPDAAFDYDGKRVVITGTVTSEGEKSARGEQAQTYFGVDTVIDNQLRVVAVATSGSDVQCGDRIAVAVNFATGSSALNAEAKAILDKVFDCLKDGRFEISGHTDNTGSAASNQRLSLARAEATKAYLVSKGAKDADLATAGYGPDKPIADNGTPEGRAQNRRIEFARQ
jgi:OmpA-OmpF porin, OOP family